MPKRTSQVLPRETPKLDGSWVVDSDEDDECLYSPSITALNRSSSLVRTATSRSNAIREDYNLQRKPPRAYAGSDIEGDALENDNGREYELPRVPAATSSQSSDLAYHKTSSQVPLTAKLEDIPLRGSARGGITACAGPDVEETNETAVKNSLSKRKTSKGKVIDLSSKLGGSSKAAKGEQTSASPRSSVETDLIMPSIHEDGLENSWFNRKNPRRRKRNRRGTSVPVESERMDRTENFRSIDSSTHVQPGTTSDSVATFLKSVVNWIFEVTGGALGKLKTPLSYFLAVYLFIGLLAFFRNLLTSSIYSALSPICRIPGASLLSLPMCYSEASVQYQGDEPQSVQFDQLMNVQSKFEAVLEQSAGGVSLPLDMKRSETSLRDLRQVVRYSDLHSKNELVLEFDGFVETARIASIDLQKFNSHVGRGVDNILATARWTKRVLEGIELRDGSKGAIVSWFHDKLLTPFQPLKVTEDTLLGQYVQYTRTVEQEINNLIDEAQVLLRVLQNLEDRLDVIHGITVRDDLHAQGSRAEVLSQLWTKMGGNRNDLGKFNSQLRLLGQVNTYRQSAIAHVSETMIKLQGMGAELEELRERVGGVELLGRSKGVPLSVHIENIELGVERLEECRNRAKGIENEELRKKLERGKRETKEIERA
ncbi:hypothetical protein MMC07_005247 [Pseudocyphellaria aurata]|nr:hypothetical protein [Pseudocyphellaria aurata]